MIKRLSILLYGAATMGMMLVLFVFLQYSLPPTDRLLGAVTGTTGDTDNRPLALSQPQYHVGAATTIGIGTLVPEDLIVFMNPLFPYNVLFRLRADGSEWYAPGVDPEWVAGLLFQLRCSTATRCV